MKYLLPLLLFVSLSANAGTCDPDHPHCVDVSEFLVQEPDLVEQSKQQNTQRQLRISPEAFSKWVHQYKRKQQMREAFGEALRHQELWREPVRCRRTFGTVTCR